MKKYAAWLLAGAISMPSGASVAADYSDDEIMTMAALEWAGINCGKMVPMEDLMRASAFMAKIDKSAWYRKRIKAQLSKASMHGVACQSLKEALGSEIGKAGKKSKS